MAGGVDPNTPSVPREVARLRELFLSGGELPRGAAVAAPILESWTRSADRHVSTDHVRPPYRALPAQLPGFATVAARVLDRTTEALGDEPVCVILTDAEGTVLLRWCGESSLRARVDRVDLAPGFAYSEPGVGTNGIGTALERGVPTLVHATEHFTDDLIGFTCAGVPVRDPRTGAVLGVVDLTTGSGRGTHLMLGFARTVAAEIEEELRRAAPAAQGERADAAEADRYPPPGARGPTPRSPSPTLVEVGPRHARHPSTPAPAGLPGRAPAWLRARRQVVSRAEERRPTVLVGERGVGKAHLALVAHRVGCVGSLGVLDAGRPELTRVPGAVTRWLEHVDAALERDTGTLLVRRVHLLPDDAATGLRHLFDRFAARHPEQGGDRPWLVLTADVAAEAGLVDHGILGTRGTIEVPALRHHAEDVPDLIAYFLARHGSPLLQLTPGALDVLAHHVWPGNVAELDDVVARLALTRHSGTVDVADLPIGHRERARHRLTALEALERDAIVRELVAKGGSKDAVARALGISRATLYRRLREYGIAWPGEARAGRADAEPSRGT